MRISFAGGGTDLPGYFERHGGAVVSVAINKYFYTVLQKRNDGNIQVISSDLRVCERWQNIARLSYESSELEIPLAVLKEIGAEVSVDLFLSSEIPPGTGLGSSAAVCVNVLKTITTYLGLELTPLQLAEEAYRIARYVLNRPVGKQDEFASAFGGLNFFRFHQNGTVATERLQIDAQILSQLQSNLMLFFTGTAHHSWTILKHQQDCSSRPASQAASALARIHQLAESARSALVSGDLRGFAGILDEGWQHKRRISEGISNSRIDELYSLAKGRGALGGKITGAGGGGFLLLYCEAENQARVRHAFESVGIRQMAFEFDFHGSSVITNDPSIDKGSNCGRVWTFVPRKYRTQS